jgi:AhpD family alkylhydroperoxidase
MSQTDSRIDPPEPGSIPTRLQPLLDRADAAMQGGELPGPTLFGNQVRALAHNPTLLEALTGVYQAFAEAPSVDRKLVELGILIVSRVNTCHYCVQHHAPLAHRSGLTFDQLNAIQGGDWVAKRELWSELEWLVIRYAEQLTRAPQKIDDPLYASLKEHFSDRQLVDLTMRLALCSAWNKFNDALLLDTESAFQHAFAELELDRGAAYLSTTIESPS